MQNRDHYTFHFSDQQLAWDFNIGPVPQQIHSLYVRVRFLPSYYMATFEEMMQIGFIDGNISPRFNPLVAYEERYIAMRLEEVKNLVVQPPLATLEDLEHQCRMEELLNNVCPRRRQGPPKTQSVMQMADVLYQVIKERQRVA